MPSFPQTNLKNPHFYNLPFFGLLYFLHDTVQVQDPLIHNRNISIFKRDMLHIL